MTDETRRLHCLEKSATFSAEGETTSLNNVMDKNRICSRGNVFNFSIIIIFSLLPGVNCVTNNNQNLTKTQLFLNGKLALLYSVLSPLNAANRILGLCKFKIFWESMPPWKRGLLIQSVTLFKSAGYFNFYWNPCKLIDFLVQTAQYFFTIHQQAVIRSWFVQKLDGASLRVTAIYGVAIGSPNT